MKRHVTTAMMWMAVAALILASTTIATAANSDTGQKNATISAITTTATAAAEINKNTHDATMITPTTTTALTTENSEAAIAKEDGVTTVASNINAICSPAHETHWKTAMVARITCMMAANAHQAV